MVSPPPCPDRRWLLALLAACGLWLVGGIALPALAGADEPDTAKCPEAPSDPLPSGAGAAAEQSYALRGAIADLCSAVTDRLDLAASDRAAAGDSLGAIEAALGGSPVEVTLADGSEVTVTNPTQVTGLRSSVDGIGETVHADIWAALGMLTGGLLLAALWRVLRP